MRLLLPALLLIIAFQAQSKEKMSLPMEKGMWLVEMEINDTTFLPFFVQLDEQSLTIINDDEHIEVEKMEIVDDSLVCTFPVFNTYLKAKAKNKKEIEGYWYYPAKGPNYKIKFHGTLTQKERFSQYKTSHKKASLHEKYEIYFSPGTDDEFPAIGKFMQHEDGSISGTFLTETGDFRFLSGNIYGDRFYLSTFDGAHAFLFTGQINGKNISGQFYSGTHYQTTFTGNHNPNFELRDPNKLTYLVDPNASITFDFKDLEGNNFKYPEDADQNKVTIIQIMGSWCPNCKDETVFFKELKEKYKNDIQIISVGFEVGKTFEAKASAIAGLQSYFETDFTYLVGGNANKGETSKAFPMLNEIISYPTSIFINKNGEVELIHTGFSGPGTGAYYTNYKKQIYNLLDQITEED